MTLFWYPHWSLRVPEPANVPPIKGAEQYSHPLTCMQTFHRMNIYLETWIVVNGSGSQQPKGPFSYVKGPCSCVVGPPRLFYVLTSACMYVHVCSYHTPLFGHPNSGLGFDILTKGSCMSLQLQVLYDRDRQTTLAGSRKLAGLRHSDPGVQIPDGPLPNSSRRCWLRQ